MPSGYGVLDVILNKTGWASVGGVGSGVAEMPRTYTKAGWAACDADGYGVSASLTQETGFVPPG